LRDSQSTSLDKFTAHDQYGLVLIKYAHEPKKAVEHFSEAIELASERLSSTDAEWAYAYWHRATAEQQLGNSAEAEKDFSVAENSLREAEKAIGNEKIAAYYHELVNRIAAQHASH
jgi:tetratricopeptide (TPR) repeat protein